MKLLVSILAGTTLLASAGAMAKHHNPHDTSPHLAERNWEVSVNYVHLNADNLPGYDLGVATAGFGYVMKNPEGHFSFTPEIQLGSGVRDDSQGGFAEVQIDSMVSVATRLTLHPTDKFQVYVRPSYNKAEISAFTPAGPVEATTDWEFGLGVGLDIAVTPNTFVSLGFDRISGDTDAITGSVRYRF